MIRHTLLFSTYKTNLQPFIIFLFLNYPSSHPKTQPKETKQTSPLSSSSSSSSSSSISGSMAIRCSSFPPIVIQNSGRITKPITRILMLKQSQIPVKKTPALQIRSSLRNKVFEDRSKGIVCYRDDSGEIICEGYDEGPRLHQLFPKAAYHPRDAEIIDLLQQSWLQIC